MPKFAPPTAEDTTQLASQWLSVSRLTETEYARPLTQALDDLALIQRLLDDDTIDRSTYPLQCLGIALGRVMAHNIPGLDWWMVDDQYGRGPCLRFLNTTLQINPLTMISKRIERGEAVDVRHLYETTVNRVAELQNQVS